MTHDHDPAAADVIDRLIAEGAVGLATLARHIEVHPATLSRWITHGSRGIHLEAIRVGNTWRSSEAALRRFLRARAAGTTPADIARRDELHLEHAASCRRLEARGVVTS